MRSLVVLSLLSILPVAFGAGYDRDAFTYRSYKPDSVVGAYTGRKCDIVNIDHVVSLKDAYESGAKYWTDAKKAIFGNDLEKNHLPLSLFITSYQYTRLTLIATGFQTISFNNL